jgi:4-alpha-glucanotransferase
MNEASIRALARQAGVDSDWIDASGRPRRVGLEPLTRILKALGYPCGTSHDLAESRDRLRRLSGVAPPLMTCTVGQPLRLPMSGDADVVAELVHEGGDRQSLTLRRQKGRLVVPPIARSGYYQLRFAERELSIAVAPRRCLTIADVAEGRKRWGVAVQLYSLAREGDGGIGDTTALRAFTRSAARHGADAVALSPVHSLYAANRRHIGPYSPSNRLFYNALYADPADALPDVKGPQLPDLSQTGLIDWQQAASAKYAVLRSIYDQVASCHLPAFDAFVSKGGSRLHEHALFEAMHAQWFESDQSKSDWRSWPDAWRGASGEAVARFTATSDGEIRYHKFLQWLAGCSFARAQAEARDAGMRIGLIADLAIGMDAAGSHAWARPYDLLTGLAVGAPPDINMPEGQNWGLVAFSPRALIETGFEPFIATLRAALRHAGGVRIDHAMGLMHLWLIPHGSSAAEGAFLNYPLEDMLRLLALESHRHGAVVVGEDLGTVPPDFRARLEKAGVGGMDVLWFQRDDKDYLPPSAWRADAMAMTTTHDLPTVAGWWSGADIEVRSGLGTVREGEVGNRAWDRGLLWQAFVNEGVATVERPAPQDAGLAVEAALAFVARSPSPLVLAPVEDLLALAEQPNLPGTIDEHPNWRRRLPSPADTMLDQPQVAARIDILKANRT